MAPNQTTLALLVLFGTAALKVYGCVCYVGQEPNEAIGKRYGWSLAEQRPCECTEFRLGGVNMKPQKKPYEVKIGEDSHVSIDEQGQIIQSPDCREDQSGTTFKGTSLCAQNTHRLIGFLDLQLPMMSPIRLEFTVNIGVSVNIGVLVHVYFSPNGPYNGKPRHRVGLGTNSIAISKWESFYSNWEKAQYETGVNYMGVPVITTYDNGRFDVAVQGVQDSILNYVVPSPPQPSWFVGFQTYTEAEFIFTEPCINDFDPKLKFF